MKITLERLREIITEEVIKEEVSPEDAKRTMVALLQGTPPNVTGDIMGDVYDEMYDADVSEPSAAPEEEEDLPTEYQAGGAYGDRPRMGFKKNININEIIQEEYHLHMIEYYQAKLGLLQEVAPPSYRQSQAHLEKTYGGDIPPTFTGAPAVPQRRPSLMSQQQVNTIRKLSSELPAFAKKIDSMVDKGVNIAKAVDFMRGFGVDPIEVLKLAHERLEQKYRNQSTHPDSVKKPELRRHETPGEYSTGIAGKTKQDFADERHDDIKRYLKRDMRRIRSNIKDMLKDYPEAAISKK